MKLNSVIDVKNFQRAINECEAPVWLRSDCENYNLKSAISQYVAIGKLLSGDSQLELFTESKDDEKYFLRLFAANPEML